MPVAEKTKVRIDFTIATGTSGHASALEVPAGGMDDAGWENLLHQIRRRVEHLGSSYGHLPDVTHSDL